MQVGSPMVLPIETAWLALPLSIGLGAIAKAPPSVDDPTVPHVVSHLHA